MFLTFTFLAGCAYAQTAQLADPSGDTAAPNDTKLDLLAVFWEAFDSDGNLTFQLTFEVTDIPTSGAAPPVGYDAHGWFLEFILGQAVHRVQVSYEPAPYGSRSEVYVCNGPVGDGPVLRPFVMKSCRGLHQFPFSDLASNRSRIPVLLTKADLELAPAEGGLLRYVNASTYVVKRGEPIVDGWRNGRLIDSTDTGPDIAIPGVPAVTTRSVPAVLLQEAISVYQLDRNAPARLPSFQFPTEPSWWWLLGGAPIIGGMIWLVRRIRARPQRNDPHQEFERQAEDYKARSNQIYRPAKKQLKLWTNNASLLLPAGVSAANPEEKVDYGFWHKSKDENRILLPQIPSPIKDLLEKAQSRLADIPHQVATVNRRAQKLLDEKAHALMEPRPTAPLPARVRVNPPGVEPVNPYELWVRRESLSHWIGRALGSSPEASYRAELIVRRTADTGTVVANHPKAEAILHEVVQELGADPDAHDLALAYKELVGLAVELERLIDHELEKVPVRPSPDP